MHGFWEFTVYLYANGKKHVVILMVCRERTQRMIYALSRSTDFKISLPLRRLRDCVWVSGRPADVGVCGVDSLEVCVETAKRRFIYLFWGSVTLST